MIHKYLQIIKTGDNKGTILNSILADDSDIFDPQYEWIKLEYDEPHRGIGHGIKLSNKVKTGKKNSFEPFKLSEKSGGFIVSYDGKNICIDCKKYHMKWLREELTIVHRNKLHKGNLMYAGRDGVIHDEYCVTYEDIEKILSTLEELE